MRKNGRSHLRLRELSDAKFDLEWKEKEERKARVEPL